MYFLTQRFADFNLVALLIIKRRSLMIIDAHSHLGYDVVFDEEQDENDLLDTYKKNHVEGAIVQPFICRPYLEDTMAIHNRIAAFCNNNKQGPKLWGMISLNPHFRPEDYEKEATRCAKQLGFVGIKIPTIANAIHPSSIDGMHVFEVAKMLGLPVMIHTGIGTPFADPMSAWKAVKAFKEVKTILAHAGSGLMVEQASIMARKFDNVYLEPSWLPGPFITSLVKDVGAEKIMFSSDICANLKIELEKYRCVVKKPHDFERIMSGTAIEVFELNI